MRKIGQNPWRRVAPVRIRSTKELSPSFKPRWLKFTARLGLAAFAIAFIASLVGLAGWPTGFSFALNLVVACIVAIAVILVGPVVLNVLGYWFPRLGAVATRLDRWLERDLDWK
jgi:Mg/Co/Ni transporter MgtE